MRVLTDQIRTCRKAALCDQCLSSISPSEKYRCIVYEDGELRAYKAHVDCDAASNDFRAIAGLFDDEDAFVSDIITEDSWWLWAEFPSVARRINMRSLSWAHERYLKWGR